jgi:hypothetical protein
MKKKEEKYLREGEQVHVKMKRKRELSKRNKSSQRERERELRRGGIGDYKEEGEGREKES